mgnify:CR=1 FL=1
MKKLVLLIMAILFSTLSISEVDYKELLKDYPYKNSAVQATVLGTPKKDFYVFKDPKGPKIGVVKTTKKIPDVLRQWENYEYGIWKQKEKAPLMVIISGTGSLYNGSYTLYMANVFYDRGYNVLTFSSTSTLPYIVSQSTNSYSGDMTGEVYNLYDIIAKEIGNKKSKLFENDHQFASYYLAGLIFYKLDTLFASNEIDKKLQTLFKDVKKFKADGCVAVGTAIGVAISVATNNIVMLPIGTSFGCALGIALGSKSDKKD